jgi:HlyD family type I secretion membrane fusion protein
MNQVVHLRTRPPALRQGPQIVRIDDSAETAGIAGWLIIAIFFGLLGTWAAVAPLNGAVVAQAVIKTDGNRKTVQHLEGGIVRRILVRDGDTVSAGDKLLELDDTQSMAELEILERLGAMLWLTEARLQAEQDGRMRLELPRALSDRATHPDVATAFASQQSQLESRQREHEGQIVIVRQRIAQLDAQLGGMRAQLDSFRAQYGSLRGELATLSPLLERGIVTRTRILQLERSVSRLDGQIGETTAGMARVEQSIAEQRQQEAQLRNQRAVAIAQELRDVETRLAEVVPKLANARAVHARTIVRAPCDGRIVGLAVFASGAVIGRGEKLMDIVPDNEMLIAEVQIPVEDVIEVQAGGNAEIRLSGYKQQSTMPLAGTVQSVSADRLTDKRTGAPYYQASIRIHEASLAAAPAVTLVPGMAATVTIPTSSRTALQYIVGPIADSLRKTMHER